MKAISFFSGALGMDLGLEAEGIEILSVCESDKAAQKTIRRNKPHLPISEDILRLDKKSLGEWAGVSDIAEVDAVVGGPPCQAFSTAGKRKSFGDERGNVLLHYLSLVKAVHPRYVVIENVRGLLSSKFGLETVDEITKGLPEGFGQVPGAAMYYLVKFLENLGYKVTFNLYNAAYFGVPQVRERVIVLACLDPIAVPYLMPTHGKAFTGEPLVTLREAIGDLQGKAMRHSSFSKHGMKYIGLLQAGQNWRDLPEEIQAEAMGKSYRLGGGKTGFFRRLAWEKPSPTLVTSPTMPATYLTHPEEDRPLSVEEYKRIQQFPDDYMIEGSLADQYKQIGNAVPVGLGRAIGRTLVKHAQGRAETPLSIKFSRYVNTDDRSWTSCFMSSLQKLVSRQLTIPM